MGAIWKENVSTLKLAMPLIIGQLTSMAMGLIDTAMVGRGLGTTELAALTFGLSYCQVPFISLFGLITAVSVLIAQAFGAKEMHRVAELLRHGLVICAMAGGLVALFLALAYGHLHRVGYLGQVPEIIPLARPYALFYSIAFCIALLFSALRSFCDAQDRPWLPLGITAAGVGLNVFLNWVLIFGNLGAPAMGLTGAGVATMLAHLFMFCAMGVVLTRVRRYGLDVATLLRPRIRWSVTRQVLNMGIPSIAQIGLEVGAFNFAAIMMGWVSAANLAAHQATLQVAAFSFMVPLGMSFAVSIKVGQAAGAGDIERVRRAGMGGIVLMGCWMAFAAYLIFIFRPLLPFFFSDDLEVIALSSSILLVTAFFQVCDGVQINAVGGLRGLGDVRIPAAVSLFAYWGIGLTSGYFLGFKLGLEGLGIWIGLAFGLLFSAVFQTARFVYLTRPGRPLMQARPAM